MKKDTTDVFLKVIFLSNMFVHRLSPSQTVRFVRANFTDCDLIC